MLNLDEKLVGVWFMKVGTQDDWMLYLREIEGGFEIEYRFRYHEHPDPFAFKDRKSWYRGTAMGLTREAALARAREVVTKFEKMTGHRADELLMVDGDVDGFIEELSRRPWAHVKKFTVQ